MKIPTEFIITTKDYVQIQTKLNLFIARYGCNMVNAYLDALPIRLKKKNGKNVGAYLVNKVCEEYQLSQYELFESKARKDITEARKVFCVLAEKYLDTNQGEIAAQFHKSRHFAKRALKELNAIISENHQLDKPFIDRFKRLDALVCAFVGFQPKSKSK